MASSDNLYLYEMTEDTNLGSTDILYAVVDPGGTPLDRFFEAGNELARFKITAAGSMLYGTAANTLAELAAGTAAYILAMDSDATAPEWIEFAIVNDTTPQLGGNLDMQDKQAYNSAQTVTFDSDGVTLDWNAGAMATITLTDNVTLTFSNVLAGTSYALEVIQDGTGGWVVTWDTDIKWPNGTAPTLTTDASAIDIINFQSFDGTTLYGAYGLKFS